MSSRAVIEYFKTTENVLVPVEFRFIRCKIITRKHDQEFESFEWMDSALWKELLEATKTLVNIQTIQKFSAFEPTLTSTSNLKIAFIVKDNAFKRPIFMDPSNTSMLGFFQPHTNSDKMLVLSVSLNKADVKLKDLQASLSQHQQVEGHLKISSYFMQTVSFPDLEK